MDPDKRRRNIILANGAGLLLVGASVLLVTTGNAGWFSWLLLGLAAVAMFIGRRFRP
jgi:hypothetical protein